VISNLYNPVDVGVLSNNIEKVFGLSALVDKLIYLCYEVKKDFKLDQGEMQSMISGEAMSIPAKFKPARNTLWKSHGLFMGNEFPSWTNNSGSIGRRIITVLFDKEVSESNPKLFEDLQQEMGYIIVKINRAYRQCAAVYGHIDIWKLLPPYFKEKRERELEAHTHVLTGFLVYIRYEDNGRTLVFDPDGTIVWTRFISIARDYICERTNKNPRLTWNAEFYSTVFYNFGLTLEDSIVRGCRLPLAE